MVANGGGGGDSVATSNESVEGSAGGGCVGDPDEDDDEDSYPHPRRHHHHEHDQHRLPLHQLATLPLHPQHTHPQQHHLALRHDELCKQEAYDLSDSMAHTAAGLGLLANTGSCLRSNETEISSSGGGDNLYCC